MDVWMGRQTKRRKIKAGTRERRGKRNGRQRIIILNKITEYGRYKLVFTYKVKADV